MGVDQRKFHTIKRLETLEQEAQAQFLIAEAVEESLESRVSSFSTLLDSANAVEKRAQDHYNAVVDASKKFAEVQKLAKKAAENANDSYTQMKSVFKQTYLVSKQTVEVANATVRLADIVQTQAEKNPLISAFIQSQTGDTSTAATKAVTAILAALDKTALALEDTFNSNKSAEQSSDATVELNPLIFYNLWERQGSTNSFTPVSFLSLKFDSTATVQNILEEIRYLYVIFKDDRTYGDQTKYKAIQVEYNPKMAADLDDAIPLFHSLNVPHKSELTVDAISSGDARNINETSSVMGIENLLLIRLEKAQKLVFDRKTALELARKMLAVATKNLAIKQTAYEVAQEKLQAAKQAVNYPA
ncbi:MAG: hypothetical protein AAF587_02545 [Bacteroidota bacterium]